MSRAITLLLAGDVMTGRGMDQLMPTPVPARICEDYVQDARDYVRLAEAQSGAIARPVADDYIWGEALERFERLQPDLRIVNLETAVTSHGEAWPGKRIHYRMHPAHIRCLRAAKIDACSLANNHVLDWGRAGLIETLDSLRKAGIATAGAGIDAARAAQPAELGVRGSRVLLFACGLPSSGVPGGWRATAERCGVNFLRDLSQRALDALDRQIAAERRGEDTVIVSLHWGGNWGYAVDDEERDFARGLIEAGVDVVHGHSSHHAKAIEVHRDRLILYGCGDFINDYEGIHGHESWRGDLAPAYFAELIDGRLQSLQVELFRSKRLRLRRAAPKDRVWWRDTLNRECARFGTCYALGSDGVLSAAADAAEPAV